MNIHEPYCDGWVDQFAECSCTSKPPWRIRRLPDELFPWQIYRLTSGEQRTDYEPLMRCSTFERANQLVHSLIWLSRQPVRILHA